MVVILLRADSLQISHQDRISIPLMFKEGCVAPNVIDARENLLEVAQSMLFLLKIKDYLHIIFSQAVIWCTSLLHLVN